MRAALPTVMVRVGDPVTVTVVLKSTLTSRFVPEVEVPAPDGDEIVIPVT